MLAFAVVLTGCSLDESTGGSGGSATTPREVEFDALYETLSTAKDGLMGEWTYTDYEDTLNKDSGSWTEDL